MILMRAGNQEKTINNNKVRATKQVFVSDPVI